MYDVRFLIEECGFDWLPDDLDLSLLHNVSYDLATGAVKLYVLDRSRRFLLKLADGKITEQHEAVSRGVDPSRIEHFLGIDLDPAEIQIDTVEDDAWYLFIEHASPSEYVQLLDAVSAKLAIPRARLVECINRINREPVANAFECLIRRAVSMVKVSFAGGPWKMYSRPYLTGNGFDLDEATTRFLARLHGRAEPDLASAIRHLWVSTELLSDRVVLATQNQALIHEIP